MSDGDVVKATCTSSLRKRSFVGAGADSGDVASADRKFEANSTLGDELDVDGLEWAVEALPVQSVLSYVMKDLNGRLLCGLHSAHQTSMVDTIDRTVVSSSKRG